MSLGIHLGALFIKKEVANCAFKHTEKAGGEPKKNLWQSLKHWISLKRERKLLREKFKRSEDFLHGVSAIPVKSMLQKVW